MQAAQDGQGLALGWMNMIKPLLSKRALVQVTSNEIAAPQAFYVTWNSKRALSREAETLRNWLLSQSA